jgi:hypothetical protein
MFERQQLLHKLRELSTSPVLYIYWGTLSTEMLVSQLEEESNKRVD